MWWLNPWAEVKKWRNSAYYLGKTVENLMVKNAELKRRIADLEQAAKENGDLCGCQGCVDLRPGLPGPGKPGWRYACEKCGNKRCPHHEWHGFKCTGSNEPDQIGEKE